jgi:hypothetical protein
VAHVDAIIQQQRAGHINLECGLVATTFQHQCNVVLRKRRAAEALEEATTVAGYASLERGCTNLGACNCDDDKEIIRAENYTSESDEDVKAAQAYLAAEDALFAHDVAVGEAVAEDLALEEHFLSQSCDDEYLCNDYECTCEGRYGLNDDGEIRYHDCH